MNTLEAIPSLRVTILHGIRVNVAVARTLLTFRLRASLAGRVAIETIDTRVAEITWENENTVEPLLSGHLWDLA